MSKAYFDNYINLLGEIIRKTNNKLTLSKIRNDRILNVKNGQLGKCYRRLIALYSIGTNLKELKKEFEDFFRFLPEYWITSFAMVKAKDGSYLHNYYVGKYYTVLNLLSIAVLLKIDIGYIKIANILEEDKVGDRLLDFMINTKQKERKIIEETYNLKHSIILKVFNNLRKVIIETSSTNQQQLIKDYLENHFYHKNAPWYNNHNGRHDTYYGYWSFESAALVCLLDLNDTSFRSNKYYPVDLVDYFRNSK